MTGSGGVVGVIQARTTSSRLPNKVLAVIGSQPLIGWTIDAMSAVAGLATLIVATTDDPSDVILAQTVADLGIPVHRGSTHDVLARCWDAVARYEPEVVVRQTADNPFVDPDVVMAQIARLRQGRFDFVGNVGWPLGIAAEVATGAALEQAAAEATDPAEREHVMPFLYNRPERFNIGYLEGPTNPAHGRFTVDTEMDLTLARMLAERLGHGPPVRLAELETLIRVEPTLANLNADVRQKSWQEVDERAIR